MGCNTLWSLSILLMCGVFFCLSDVRDAGAGSDLYGAVSISPSTRAYGYSYDLSDRESAKKRALDECRSRSGVRDCKTVVWFINGCGALAIGDIGYGSGWGGTREWAEHYALESCASWTGSCKIVRWVCTSNAAPAE